jgi:hypothetical protein
MKLQIQVQEMVKRFSRHPPNRTLGNICKNRIPKLGEDGGGYPRKTVCIYQLTAASQARGRGDSHPATSDPPMTHTVESAVMGMLNASMICLKNIGT